MNQIPESDSNPQDQPLDHRPLDALELDPLESQIRASFEALGYAQLSAIACDTNGDEVRLSGVLDSFYLKQVAQSVAVRIPGVRLVKNEIEVE